MVAARNGGETPTKSDFHAAITSRSDRWYLACVRITRCRDLAEDAVQEALLTAWKQRREFRHTAKLETWIHRIAVNAALQLLRKQRPALHESLEADVSDHSTSLEQSGYEAELNQELTRALGRLTDFERVCFVLKHLEEWRYAEIAADLDTSASSAKQAVFRATRKLRANMANLKR